MHRCRQNCRCLLFPSRYQQAFWHRFFQRQADEFPAINGFFSKVKKSNLLGTFSNSGALTRCGEIPFPIGKTATDPLLSCLRRLFEPPKLPKSRNFPSRKTAPIRDFCPLILRRIPCPLGRQPMKNFFFATDKAEFFALFGGFCRFQSQLRKLFLTFFIFFVILGLTLFGWEARNKEIF